jgi:hypothetical protein
MIGAQAMARPPKRGSELRAVTLAVRVRPSLRRAIDKLADEERRSVSAMLEILLEEALQARGVALR